jgi:hypothetical protein
MAAEQLKKELVAAHEPALRSRSESCLQALCEPSQRSVVPRTGRSPRYNQIMFMGAWRA